MKKRLGFTLLEMSVVLLVTGLVVAGVSRGIKVLNSAKLSAAQVITKKSPVLDTEGLIMWYETTLAESFLPGENVDNVQISSWNDIAPKVKSVKNNATQSTSTYKPIFTANFFGGFITAVKFDGVNDYLSFNGKPLVGTNYTIFVVEKRSQAVSDQYFIGGNVGVTDQNLVLGYRTNALITQAHYLDDLDVAITSLTSPQESIHTFWFSKDSNGGKKYWQNGGANPKGSAAQTNPITDYAGAMIGKYWNTPFNGYLAEIIVFNRALENKERRLIEDYLGKKYRIAVDRASSSTIAGIGACNGTCSCAPGYSEVSGSCQANCTVSIVGVSATTANAGSSGNFTCSGGLLGGTVAYSCSNGSLSAGTCGCMTGYTMVSGSCQANCAVNIQGVTPTSVDSGSSGNITCDIYPYYGTVSYSCNNGTLTRGNCPALGYDGCSYYSQSCTCSNTARAGNCSNNGNQYGNFYLYCHCDGWY